MTETVSLPVHVQQKIERIRERYPAEHRLQLQFGDCTVEVAANRKDLVLELSDYFGPFVGSDCHADVAITLHEGEPPNDSVTWVDKQPEPGKRKIKEAYCEGTDGRMVRKRLTGMVFLFGNGSHAAVGPCRDNINQVVNFVNNRYIEWLLCRGFLLGHAAGVSLGERGLALAGFSGAGKSTLALHLMSRGATFVSNDRLVVGTENGAPVMHGVAKLPRINPGTALNNHHLLSVMPSQDRERFAGLSESRLWELEHKYDVPIDRCFGPGRFRLSAPLAGLVILNWRRQGGAPTLRSVDPSLRRDLLPAFIKSVGLFFRPSRDCRMPEPSEMHYVQVLSRCGVWEISGGVDFQEAADACYGILQGDAASV